MPRQRNHVHPFFLILRVCFGVAILFFGLEKLGRLDSFIDIVASYRLPGVVHPLDEWVAYGVVATEVLLGISLVFRLMYRGALLLQGGLFLAFMGAVTHLHRAFPDRDLDCGCFPWKSSAYWPHVIGLGLGVVIVVILWQENYEAHKHRFQGSRMNLPRRR